MRSAPSSIVMSGFIAMTASMCLKNVLRSSPEIANTGIPYSSTRPAAASSCEESGLDEQRATFAPPSLRVIIRLAVSTVTCRQAPTRCPLKGFSFRKRSRIPRRTGISCAAHSMRSAPSFANLLSLISNLILASISVNRPNMKLFSKYQNDNGSARNDEVGLECNRRKDERFHDKERGNGAEYGSRIGGVVLRFGMTPRLD